MPIDLIHVALSLAFLSTWALIWQIAGRPAL